MGQETSIGSMSALAVTFDVAGHEVPCFRLLPGWWGTKAKRGRVIEGPRACPSKLQILEGALRAVDRSWQVPKGQPCYSIAENARSGHFDKLC